MKRWLKIVGGSLLVVLLVLAVLLFTPILDPDLSSDPQPASSYDEAAARVEAIQADETGQALIPEGRSIALLTGSQEETAVVIFHGYTSVPAQFRVVAQGYRDQGYNVWVPRLPFHGQRDKMTSDFSKITEKVARDFADDNIDIAQGLGRKVVVVGLSGGGSLAAWSGGERADVDQTILISPVLHPLGIPYWADRPIARALRLSPIDIYQWWNDDLKANNVEGYNYPRLSLGGLAAMLSLTHFVEDDVAARDAKVDTDTLLVRNDGDQRLDSAYNERFMKQIVDPQHLRIFRIPASAGLLHNFVSVEPYSESYDHIDVAYEYLSDALGIPLPDPTP